MIDIVIPHFGNDELLERCLASIEANTQVEHRVIVVDNNKENRGFAAACNEGIRQGSGEYVVLLNNDTEVPEGWLANMRRVLEADDEVAVVGPLSTAKTQWQWTHNVGQWLERNVPTDDYVTSAERDFPKPLAFWCAIFPRQMLDHIGLLDEQFFMYCEDDDWCLRAKQTGYHMALDLATVVSHDHRTNYTPKTRRIHQESYRKFLAKWKGIVQPAPNVLVGVLNQGNVRVELAAWFIEELSKPQAGVGRVTVTFSDYKPIAHNRNTLVQQMLEGDYQYLLMIDSDTIPQRNPLELCRYNLDIIGLPTPIFNIRRNPDHPIYWNVGKWNPDTGSWHPLVINTDAEGEGPIKVDAVGTGVFLVHRRVLEHPDMRGPFRRAWDENGLAIRGLDLEMCRRAKEAGFEVWIDIDYTADHFKEVSLRRIWSLMKQDEPAIPISENGDEVEIIRKRRKKPVGAKTKAR